MERKRERKRSKLDVLHNSLVLKSEYGVLCSMFIEDGDAEHNENPLKCSSRPY